MPGPGPHRKIVWANHDSDRAHYAKTFQPNCFQAAKDIGDNPCGGGLSDWLYPDNVVSFWMGSEHSGFRTDYKVYSEDAGTTPWLRDKQAKKGPSDMNTRIYQFGSEGNAYFCLPARFPADKLRFGW